MPEIFRMPKEHAAIAAVLNCTKTPDEKAVDRCVILVYFNNISFTTEYRNTDRVSKMKHTGAFSLKLFLYPGSKRRRKL